jgi:hypothetical protein
MKKYFTSLQVNENLYTGTVYDANTNQPVYTSKAYPSQSQAMQDINTYIITSKPPTTEPIYKPETIINSTKHVGGAPRGSGRCCGR